ncbi:uncharacterized protein LOC125674557 [Ostrea edulis]|uniref:uncharacterized protein LOC125674557 n=1 Tax=Ostrea edulis TaxID=37623 RepID=UPI0024AF223D|nr:uncharacterized protein LOC125674557 [Ostrea edulis]
MNNNEILQEPIWNNKHFLFNGKTIYFKNWIKNIKYVKDLFNDSGFKTIDEISKEICKKANVLCEYKIVKSAFKYIREKIHGYESKFINIKDKRYFNFTNKYCTVEKQKRKFFYEILLSKLFISPKHHNLYHKEYNVSKEMWKHIYQQKIKLALDRIIAEFNYKLMHNLLSCKKYMFKWKKESSDKCSLCLETEDMRHLIYECKNVSLVWNMVSLACKVNIQWKSIVIGFYFECNQSTRLLNNFISFIALKIYKYKMFCRLSNLEETEYSISNHVKKCTVLWCKVIKYSNYALKTNAIEHFIKLL